jgi:hypothetical protein
MSSPERPPRCTRQEFLARVQELQAAIAAGETLRGASRRLCREWNLRGRKSRTKYVNAALADWSRDQPNRRESFQIALARRGEILRRSMKAGDYAVAMKACRAIEELESARLEACDWKQITVNYMFLLVDRIRDVLSDHAELRDRLLTRVSEINVDTVFGETTDRNGTH